MRSAWITWVSPKSNDKCPSRSKAEGGAIQREDTEGWSREDEGRDQGRPPPPPQAGGGKEELSPRVCGGSVALPALRFWTSGL